MEYYRDIYKAELRKSPDGLLIYSHEKDIFHRYYHSHESKGKRTRKRITSKPELVNALARKAYLEKALQVCENNIATLKDAMQHYDTRTAADIVASLQKKYPQIPTLNFLQPTGSDSSAAAKQARIIDTGYAENGISLDVFKWAEMDYPKNQHPFRNALYTSRGLRVRSKNELLIAEKLYAHNIPFRYDAVLDLGGNQVSPDFEFCSNAHLLKLWEHCGMMHSEDYRSDYYYKRNLYDDYGFVPWRNIIFTFSRDNDINLAEIDSIITTKLLPWLLEEPKPKR